MYPLIFGQDYDDEDDEDELYEEEGGGLDDVDSIHAYDEDDIDEFVSRASYFQDYVPIFHGLTDEEATKKKSKSRNMGKVTIDQWLMMSRCTIR